MGGPLGGFQFAAHLQRDPLRAPRTYADIVLPGQGIERLLDHFGERARRQRLMDVAERVRAKRGEGFGGTALAGKDHLGVGTDGADLPQELYAPVAVSALPSHHQVVGCGLQERQRLPPIVYSLKTSVLSLEQPGEKFVDGGIFVDHQKSAWTHPFTVADPLKRRNLRPSGSISVPG